MNILIHIYVVSIAPSINHGTETLNKGVCTCVCGGWGGANNKMTKNVM